MIYFKNCNRFLDNKIYSNTYRSFFQLKFKIRILDANEEHINSYINVKNHSLDLMIKLGHQIILIINSIIVYIARKDTEM